MHACVGSSRFKRRVNVAGQTNHTVTVFNLHSALKQILESGDSWKKTSPKSSFQFALLWSESVRDRI